MATLRDGEVAGSNIPIVDIQPLLGGVGTFGTGEAVGRVVKEIEKPAKVVSFMLKSWY